MARIRGLLTIAIALMILSGTPAAGQVKIGPEQRYLILEIVRIATLATELNDAGKQGFRLQMSAVDGTRVTALMARATPSDTFEYRIVSTFSSKTGDQEMNAAAAAGFRVVPHTFMVKKGLTIFNIDNVVVMERTSRPTTSYEYKTINAVRTPTFERELLAAIAEGWQAFDMVYGQLLMERPRQLAPIATPVSATVPSPTPAVLAASVPPPAPVVVPAPPPTPTPVKTPSPSAPPESPVRLLVSVQVLDADLNSKAVPRHVLVLTKTGGSESPIRLVTGLDGKVEAQVGPGAYTLMSERPVEFQTHRYRWERAITITAGNTVMIDLTVDAAIDDAVPARGAAPAAAVQPAPSVPDLRGEWRGEYAGLPARLVLDPLEGTNLSGMLFVTAKRGKEQTEIRVAGTVAGRTVEFREVEVVSLGAVERWSLGTSSGTMAADGRLSGTGKDGKNSYKWSFAR